MQSFKKEHQTIDGGCVAGAGKQALAGKCYLSQISIEFMVLDGKRKEREVKGGKAERQKEERKNG